MSSLFLDAFTRADSTGLGTGYTPSGSVMNVVSNRAEDTAGSGAPVVHTGLGLPPDDQWARCKYVLGTDPSMRGGVVVRYTDSDHHYLLIVEGVTTLTLYKNDGGYDLLSSDTGVTVMGDEVYLEVQGTTLRVYRNGVLLPGMTVTDAALSSGYCGLVSFVTGVAFDDFEYGDFLGGGPEVDSVGGDDAAYDGETGVAVAGSGFGPSNADRDWSLVQGAVELPLVETGTGDDTTAMLSFLDLTLEGVPGLRYGPAMVRLEVDGEDPVEFPIQFNPKAGQLYVNVVDPLADPADRVETDPALDGGDQLHAFGDMDIEDPAPDGLGIFEDATAGFEVGEEPVAFYARAYDDGDKTWGAPALQSVGGGDQDGDLTVGAGMGATFAGVATGFAALSAGVGAGSVFTGRAAAFGVISAGVGAGQADTGLGHAFGSQTVASTVSAVATALADADAAITAGVAAGETWAARAVAAAALAAGGSFGASFAYETTGAETGALTAGTSAGAAFTAAAASLAALAPGISAAAVFSALGQGRGTLTAGAAATFTAAALVVASSAIAAGISAGAAWAGRAVTAAALAAAGQFGATFNGETQSSQAGALAAGTTAGATFAAIARGLGVITGAGSFGAALAALAQGRASFNAAARFGAVFSGTGGAATILPPARQTLVISRKIRTLRIPPRVRSTRLH